MADQQGSESRRLVVIGGGVAGSLLAHSLQFHTDVTLIDPKEYFDIPWAILRNMVEPSFGERSVVNHREYLTNGRIITSKATGITDKDVLTADGQVVPYDYLVIAAGRADPVPKTRQERLAEYQAENEKIKSANSILIIGGGPRGVELAGEIVVDFPEKKVTLVHSRSRLMEFVGPKASDKALKWLRSKKVDVKLEQRVDLNSITEIDGNNSKIYHTSNGETIEADCHFLCTANPLSSAWIKDTILKDSLDSSGYLVVDDNLRVKGHRNIFAIGDIANIPEIKQGYLAQRHAAVVAKNLKLLMSGRKESKMGTYKAASDIAMVSLGRRDAVVQFPYVTLIGVIPGMIKSRDLFVGKTRKERGLQP